MPSASPTPIQSQVNAKQALVEHALAHHLRPDMTIGLGSGTTAEAFIAALAQDKAKRPRLCLASSQASHQLATSLGLPIVCPDSFFAQSGKSPPPLLDLTVDGADAIDPSLRLVKGGGGCLLREKILAQSSRSMLVLAEERKLTPRLGAFPLPVEIDPFAWQLTANAITALFERTLERSGRLTLRYDNGDGNSDSAPSLSDGGNYTLDCDWGEWNDDSADRLALSLKDIAGVLEHGLFVNEASLCLLAHTRADHTRVDHTRVDRVDVRELLRPV